MAQHHKYPEVVAVRLSTEGKAKLRQLSSALQLTECDVVRRLIRWAEPRPAPEIRFSKGGRDRDEGEAAVVVGAE